MHINNSCSIYSKPDIVQNEEEDVSQKAYRLWIIYIKSWDLAFLSADRGGNSFNCKLSSEASSDQSSSDSHWANSWWIKWSCSMNWEAQKVVNTAFNFWYTFRWETCHQIAVYWLVLPQNSCLLQRKQEQLEWNNQLNWKTSNRPPKRQHLPHCMC